MADNRNQPQNKSNISQSRVGSGFTNLQRVLDANAQNRLGRTIQSGIGSESQDTRERLKKEQQEFQGQAEKGRLDTTANVEARQGILGRAATGQGPSEEETKQFEMFRAGEYKGPQTLENQAQMQEQARELEGLGRSSQDSGSRGVLLQRFLRNSPRYSVGQQSLDNLLLGQDRKAIGSIRKETLGLAKDVEGAGRLARNVSQEFAGRAKGFAEETGSLIEQQERPVKTELESKLSSLKQQEETRQTAGKNFELLLKQQAPQFSEAELKRRADAKINTDLTQPKDKDDAYERAISLARSEGLVSSADDQRLTNLFARANQVGFDIKSSLANKIRDTQAENLTMGGIANQEQANKINALAKLAGKEGLGSDIGKFKKGTTRIDLDEVDRLIAEEEAKKANISLPADYSPDPEGKRPNVLGAVLGGVVGGAIAGPVGAAVGNVVGAVSNVFCFTGDNYVRLSDGTEKQFKDLDLGDDLWLGGKIQSIGKSFANAPIYEYKNTYVLGDHTVFENGKWLQVKDSSFAKLTDLPETTIVYPFVSENRLVVVDSVIATDMIETPFDWQITDEERMEYLNNDVSRNKELLEIQKELDIFYEKQETKIS